MRNIRSIRSDVYLMVRIFRKGKNMYSIVRTEHSYCGGTIDVYLLKENQNATEEMRKMWLEDLKYAEIDEEDEDNCECNDYSAWVDYDGNTIVHYDIVKTREV